MNAIGLALLLLQFDSGELSVEAIVSRTIDARTSIKSMSLGFRYERYIKLDGDLTNEWSEEVRCWFDSNHYRMDRVREGMVVFGSDIGRRQLICKNCERPGHLIFYTEGLTAVELISPSDKLSQGYMSLIYNPLQIGFTLWHTSGNTFHPNADPVGEDIQSKSFTRPTVSKSTYRDESAIVLQSNSTRSGAMRLITILPLKGYAVAKLESTRVQGSDRHTKIQTNDLRFDSTSKLWFPKKATYEEAINGKVSLREVVTVQDCEINKPIPAQVFSFAGMAIRSSTPVFTPEAPKSLDYEWSGTAIVRRKEDPYSPASTSHLDVPLPVDANAVGRNWTWYYIGAAGLFLAAAGLLFWWAFRKRTQA